MMASYPLTTLAKGVHNGFANIRSVGNDRPAAFQLDFGSIQPGQLGSSVLCRRSGVAS